MPLISSAVSGMPVLKFSISLQVTGRKKLITHTTVIKVEGYASLVIIDVMII